MSERPEEATDPAITVPPDAPEADALEQALPWASEDQDEELPASLPEDAAEGDALDQARKVELGDDDEEPA